MATIDRQYSFIWYGICTDTSSAGGGCSSFNLTTDSAEQNKIDTVWQIDGSGDAQAFVNGATGPQPFDSLECGYAYYIKLKDATSYDCEIPHAQLSSYGENAPAEFRITSDCTAGDGGDGGVLQASIGLGTCGQTINLSAEEDSAVGSYETCQLEATGANFTPIADSEIGKIRFNLTESGLLSYRIDNTDTVGPVSGTDINISATAKDGFDFGTSPSTLTIRVNGSVIAKPVFSVISGPISETLAEGYTNGAGGNNATPTTTVVTEATEIASVAITINNNNHVEYSLDGTNWSLLSSTATTITDNFTNLELRTKTGLSADLNSTISFVATGNDSTVLSAETLSYDTTIGSYSISLSSNKTENVEENAEGSTHKFTITHTGLSKIDVALNESNKYSMSKTSSITATNETLSFMGSDLESGPIDFYIKLRSKNALASEDVTITVTGTPEIGSATKSDTATLTSNLVPHPTIDTITINTSGLNSTGGNIIASITTSNTSRYGAHHWHYTISNDDGDISTSTDVMVNSSSGGYAPATITDTNVIETPGTYTITAWIVNILGGHERVSEEKTQQFTIPTVATSMNLSTSAINRNIDVSKTIPSDTISITKENITDVSLSSLTNWTATLSGDTITVTYNGTTTISEVTNVEEETLTVTGTKGKRSGTSGTTIIKEVTLNATLFKDAEFAIDGNLNVNKNRTYNGAESSDSQTFTLTNKKNVTYTASGAMDGWQVSVNGGGYGSDRSVLENLSEGDTFKFKHTEVNAGTYPQRTITLSPTITGVDAADLGDPNPNNVEIKLNATISKANPSVSSSCGSLPSIEIEVGSTSDESNNSETCSFTLENCTVSDTTGTKGIFSYKIASNEFTYWITDASTIVASSTETLDVSLNLTDSTNYEFSGGQSPISVSMVGQVNGKATSLGVDDDSAIALGDVEQNAVTTGKKITINEADNLASATISVSGGGFKISATDGSYGTADVTINDPLNKDFYIKLDSSGALGSANSIVTVSGTKSAVGASDPADVTINCTANITTSQIPENSSITIGDCPKDISQDASTTATQTSCQLTLVNAVCVEITETTNNGIKYSLTPTGLLTYEASNPESVGTHSHQVTITANSDNASASLFTGQSTSATLNVTMSITINEVVVADDKLWIGFSGANAGGTKQYSDWYELEETQATPIGNAIDVTSAVDSWNGVIWDNVLAPQNVPSVEKILPDTDGTITFEKIKHSCVHPLSPTTTLFSVLTANSKTLGGFTYTTSEELLNAMDGNVQITRTTIAADWITTFEDEIKYELIGKIAPPYSIFSIAPSDASSYASSLSSFCTNNAVTEIPNIVITANPTKPDNTANSKPWIAKAFDSDLFRMRCNETWNFSDASSEQYNLKIDGKDGASADKTFRYSPSSPSGHASGPWSGIGMQFSSTAGLTPPSAGSSVGSIPMLNLKLEKGPNNSGVFSKLSDGTPEGSICS